MPHSGAALSITALVAAKNEEVNIGRCLASTTPARHVVVLDSGSTDATAEVARMAGAQVVQFHYRGGYPKKRQWALDTLPIDTDWVLLLDADELVPPTLWREIAEAIDEARGASAFLIKKGFHFLGRRMRFGGFSHSAVLLFRTGCARFERILNDSVDGYDMEIHERLIVDGTIRTLKTPLVHEDFKGLEAYIARHNAYSTWEARLRSTYLQSGRYGDETIRPRLFGNSQERRRFLKKIVLRIPFEPAIWFFYHYVVRLGILEGRAGLIASQIRASYIAQVRAKIHEERIRESDLARTVHT